MPYHCIIHQIHVVGETFIGDIFEILGQYCPLIQDCELQQFKIHATDIQIDTFTKGCVNLKSLSVTHEEGSSSLVRKLLHSFANNKTALEILELSNYGNDIDENNCILSSEQSTSLQSLSNGYPLLNTLSLYGFRNLSTSDISYLLNRTPKLSECDLCQDGGVITKNEMKANLNI